MTQFNNINKYQFPLYFNFTMSKNIKTGAYWPTFLFFLKNCLADIWPASTYILDGDGVYSTPPANVGIHHTGQPCQAVNQHASLEGLPAVHYYYLVVQYSSVQYTRVYSRAPHKTEIQNL